MSQLSFSFSSDKNLYLEDDFVFLEENLAARNFLEKFFSQKDFSSSQLQSLILKGQKDSGKTHLCNIFARKYRVEFLDMSKITTLNIVNFFQENQFYILEDFDLITNEELLFHLVNSVREAQAFLLLTTNKSHKFKLKDLVSRLKNIISVEIENPKIDAIEQLLINRLSRKQIRLPQKEIKSILRGIDLNYSVIDLVVRDVGGL